MSRSIPLKDAQPPGKKPVTKPLAKGRQDEQLSAADELAIIKRIVARLKTDPQALQEVAQRAGIVTAGGKLTKRFGG